MTLLLGILFIFIQGFFSGLETAYIEANPVRVAHFARKTHRYEKAIAILNTPELLLVVTLICSNIAVVLSGVFLTTYFIGQFGPWGTTIAIIVGASTGLLLGEYLPKSFARLRAERIVVLTAGFFNVAVVISRPFRRIFRKPKSAQQHGERLSITRLDMLTAFRLGEKIGSIEEKTSPRVANLFNAFDTPLGDVMTPWDRVTTIGSSFKRARILKIIEEEGYTRYPVLDHRSGRVKGILHAKDLLGEKSGLRRPFFTKPGVRITELLRTMQNNRAHMAIVLDREDNPTGLVTLEDLLEEFVGEIRSEE